MKMTMVNSGLKGLNHDTVVGNKMSVETYKFVNVRFQIKQNNMSNFHPLEVVGQGSETKLQVGENLSVIM